MTILVAVHSSSLEHNEDKQNCIDLFCFAVLGKRECSLSHVTGQLPFFRLCERSEAIQLQCSFALQLLRYARKGEEDWGTVL